MRPVSVRRAAAMLLSLSVVATGFLSGGFRGPVKAQATTGTISSWSPSGALNVTSIAPGSDGSLWFVANGSNDVGRISPDGSVHMLAAVGLDHPAGIVQAGNGYVCGTSAANNKLFCILPSTEDVQVFDGFNAGDVSGPTAIAVDGTGLLWWTNTGNNSIGHQLANGSTVHYTDASLDDPESLAPTPNGIVIASRLNDTIALMDATGAVTHAWSTADMNLPSSITFGPDGNAWFVNADSVGRINLADGTTTKFTPAALTAPRQIASGPDGNLWVTNSSGSGTADALVRLSTSGAATAFTSSAYATPYAVAFGADNWIWVSAINDGTHDSRILRVSTGAGVGAMHPFAVWALAAPIVADAGGLWTETDRVTRLATNGAIQTASPLDGVPSILASGGKSGHSVWGASGGDGGVVTFDRISSAIQKTGGYSAGDGGSAAATVGPDGALYRTTEGAIYRFDTKSFTWAKFPNPFILGAGSITSGPDGNLWFTNFTGNTIGRVTPGGVVTIFHNNKIQGPSSIVRGSDGALWFTNINSNAIGRVTTSGAFTFYTSSKISAPYRIAAGPDGALWFTQSKFVGRITTSGTVTTYAIPSTLTRDAMSIAAGSDGAVWITTFPTGVVIRINTVHDTTAPAAAAPKAAPAQGVYFGVGPITRVTLSGTDSGRSGIDHYELQQQVDGGSWTWTNHYVKGPSIDLQLAPSHTYRFRARAVDRAGNVGAFATGVTYKALLVQQTSSAAVYSSGWSSESLADFSGGSAKYATVAGKSVTYTFTGRSVGWVTSKGPDRGKARVYIDGTLISTIDLYSASFRGAYQAFTRTFSTSATHKIKIVVLGTTGRPRVDVDAFIVFR